MMMMGSDNGRCLELRPVTELLNFHLPGFLFKLSARKRVTKKFTSTFLIMSFKAPLIHSFCKALMNRFSSGVMNIVITVTAQLVSIELLCDGHTWRKMALP
jgi:hypothetical protein